MNNRWQALKIGDRVRFVHMPTAFSEPRHFVPKETIQVYRNLIARRRSVRVCNVDEQGIPWIRCQFQRKNGGWNYHWLMINHDGWIQVVHRTRRKNNRKSK